MNILAVDCSGDILSVGAGRSMGIAGRGPEAPKHPYREERGHGHAAGPSFACVSVDAGFRHAERVMSAVEYCLGEAGLAPSELDLLACAGGPGSFTGLRIGMATVKGLSLGLDKPFVAVPTLDAMAADWEGASRIIVPIIDAKRARFYFAIYDGGRLVAGPFDDGLPRLIELTQAYPELLFVGPDADLLESSAAERPGFRIAAERRRSPIAAMARLAVGIYERDGPAPSDAGLEYLRASDAEEAAAATSGAAANGAAS
ncbi:MAG TPA: tRNA (adenosine(37)-N6)-threonylcarbamoyltransferase complex dimerization subunit type 1 TsaB [Spirochaetales bacterium]|nr:tRNA (adenosine(37)-N6)-threonylcarbamoyltransferase complex dimerization subunit type 1 TsaB [Spirochaetales bacterium]HPG86745.1 tRNA (adenosine(37)-N6)-threonylcarbamoyltransferase complex dimerization subunit type 1 TsaB [Spirochaetales bacterium]HPM71903.1 tRNA (adenosine(37)-N6)-threonylcarbamoyltransferase complex dimerization subunit type 1 TsaB [Spirochaetales bacterium]